MAAALILTMLYDTWIVYKVINQIVTKKLFSGAFGLTQVKVIIGLSHYPFLVLAVLIQSIWLCVACKNPEGNTMLGCYMATFWMLLIALLLFWVLPVYHYLRVVNDGKSFASLIILVMQVGLSIWLCFYLIDNARKYVKAMWTK